MSEGLTPTELATEQLEEFKLGRVGHYSWQEACQTASVVYVHTDAVPLAVNVAGWTHDGDTFRREQVPVGPVDGDTHEFHLNRDCPWGR